MQECHVAIGCGRSDAPDDAEFGIEPQAGYIVALLDALGIERTTVVGHDIGGGVAQILALGHADRVERLGLVNSVCYDSLPIPEMKVLQKTALLADHLPPGLAMEGIEMGLRRGFVRRERADEYLDAFLEPFRTDRGLHVFLRHVGALDPAPTEELAPRLLEAPTA